MYSPRTGRKHCSSASRVQWLALGDQNTSYFHKKIASNWNQNKITSLIDANDMHIHESEAIQMDATNYFKHFF